MDETTTLAIIAWTVAVIGVALDVYQSYFPRHGRGKENV